MAKGLLTESGLKLGQFSKVTYGNTSGGGLVALSFDMADVTVADETQAKEWITQHPGQARILKTTRPVPGGMDLVVRKDFCAPRCAPPRRLGQLARRRDPGRRPGAHGVGRRGAPVHVCRLARHRHAGNDQRRHAGERRAGRRARPARRDRRRHALAEGIRERAHPRRGARLLSREEPEGDRLRRQEGRFQGVEDDPQGQAGCLPVQRPGMVEVVQGVARRGGRGLRQDYWFRGGMPEWREKRLPVEGRAGAALAKVPAPGTARGKTVAAVRRASAAARLCRAREPGLAAQVDDALALLAVEPGPGADALAVGVDGAAQGAGVDRRAAFGGIDVHESRTRRGPTGASGADGVVALQHAFAAIEDAVEGWPKRSCQMARYFCDSGSCSMSTALLATRRLSPVCSIVTLTISPSREVVAPFLPMLARQRPARLSAFFSCQRQAATPPPSRRTAPPRSARRRPRPSRAATGLDVVERGERQRCRAERRRRRARDEAERAQVVAEARQVFVPVVGAQAPPGALGELVERRRQRRGRRASRLTPSHMSGMTWALAAIAAASSSRIGSSSRSMQGWPSPSRAPR